MKKNIIAVLSVCATLALLLSGCDLPFLPRPATETPASVAPTPLSTKTAAETPIAAPSAEGTATLLPEERGPDAYYEHLAAMRMLAFETAYNKVAKHLEDVSADMALLVQLAFVSPMDDDAEALRVAGLALFEMDTDVANVTGFSEKYAHLRLPFWLPVMEKSQDARSDVLMLILYRDQEGFQKAINAMKALADAYSAALDAYIAAGGPVQ